MSANLADRLLLATLGMFAAYLQFQIQAIQTTFESFVAVEVAHQYGKREQGLDMGLSASADYHFSEKQLSDTVGLVGVDVPPVSGYGSSSSRTDLRSPDDMSGYDSYGAEAKALGPHVSPDDMTVYINDDDAPRLLGIFIPVYDMTTSSLLMVQ